MPITKAPKVRIYNASGETIPARSFVQVDADRARGDHSAYDVVKPDGTGLVYLVTENRDIASEDYGIAYNPISPVPVKHASEPSPVVEVGPSSGSWEMSTDGDGFAALRVEDSYTYVQRTGGGGCACQEIWCFLPLDPTAGTWSFDLTVNGSEETMTLDYDCTSSDLDTELATHSQLTGSEYAVVGGPFPLVALYIEWIDPTDSDVVNSFPVMDISSLTGGMTMYKFSRADGN